MLQNSAEFSKLLLPVSSRISSKTAVRTTKDFFIKTLAKAKAVFASVLGVEPNGTPSYIQRIHIFALSTHLRVTLRNTDARQQCYK